MRYLHINLFELKECLCRVDGRSYWINRCIPLKDIDRNNSLFHPIFSFHITLFFLVNTLPLFHPKFCPGCHKVRHCLHSHVSILVQVCTSTQLNSLFWTHWPQCLVWYTDSMTSEKVTLTCRHGVRRLKDRECDAGQVVIFVLPMRGQSTASRDVCKDWPWSMHGKIDFQIGCKNECMYSDGCEWWETGWAAELILQSNVCEKDRCRHWTADASVIWQSLFLKTFNLSCLYTVEN